MFYTNIDFRIYTKHQTGYYEIFADDITYTTNRFGVAGKLEFTLLKTPNLAFYEGDMVTLYIDYTPIFKGYVFKKTKNEKGELTVTCYDQLRYLKAKQSYVIDMTATDLLKMVAAEFRLELGEVDDTGYVLPAYVEENRELFEIVTKALDKTQIVTGDMFVLYDHFGKLNLKAVANMGINYVIGEKSLATGFEYTTSIDDETYNYIKIVRPNESTGRADVYVYNDENNIGLWGMLQLYHQVDKDTNEAQIRELGHQLLNYHNKVWDTLNIDCLGILGLIAGNTIAVELDDLGETMRLIVDKCTHTFKDGKHTMSLELIIMSN